jgi:hypothetical protein
VYVILSNIIIQLITLVQLFYHATCFPIETKLIIYIYIYIYIYKERKKRKKKREKAFHGGLSAFVFDESKDS